MTEIAAPAMSATRVAVTRVRFTTHSVTAYLPIVRQTSPWDIEFPRWSRLACRLGQTGAPLLHKRQAGAHLGEPLFGDLGHGDAVRLAKRRRDHAHRVDDHAPGAVARS